MSVQELEKMIDSALSENLTSIEKGKVYTEAILAYMHIKNEVDKVYLETIEKGMQSLSELIDNEKKDVDEVEKDVIRQKLQEIDDMD